jgi:hypothetical protein
MNIFQVVESFFGFGPKSTPAAHSQFQNVIDETGKIIDTVETSVTNLQPFVAVYPPLAGYLSAISIAVHALDGWVDTLETPAVPAPPVPVNLLTTPAPEPSVPAAPGATPTANL